jgi:lysophospholipase L1-like esterase
MAIDRKKKILAVGDCNTSGIGELNGQSYPERLEKRLQIAVTNCGHTMATSREGYYLLRDNLTIDCSIVIIQFGLGDASLTLRHAPYVLNYPDNIFRKPCRKILKKIKKLTRKYGINQRFGESNIVPLEEYSCNMRRMIEMCAGRIILLPETIPHRDTLRNAHITRYNREVAALAAQYPSCYLVKIYNGFSDHMDHFYLDSTHSNAKGHDFIAESIVQVLEQVSSTGSL